jgi:hypothetical protein
VKCSFHQPDPWRNGSASDSRSPILIRILFSFSFLFLGFQFFLPHMKKAESTLNGSAHGPISAATRPKPSTRFRNLHSPSLSPPPTSARPASAPTKQRDREAGEPSRPRAPSHLRDSAMATVMQKIKDIEDEVTIPPQVHLVFAAPGCRLPC